MSKKKKYEYANKQEMLTPMSGNNIVIYSRKTKQSGIHVIPKQIK